MLSGNTPRRSTICSIRLSARRPASAQAPRHQQRRKKIFSREDGEYVEFEEIDVKVDYRAQETAEKHGPAYTPREPQVSDAEWEEIR